MAMIDQHPLASALVESDRRFLEKINNRYQITYQQMRILIEQALDLSLWCQTPLSTLWDDSIGKNLSGKGQLKAIINDVIEKVSTLRKQPTDYSDFSYKPKLSPKITHVEALEHTQLLGRCPCPVSGEKTRCCNLQTLDVVQQCAFACSYCSIQSFYHKDEIIFAANLDERLKQLELPPGTWHIGTGQSSDSLLWGNDHGVLDALVNFSTKHPQVVIELKTKSSRTDWIDQISLPKNMVVTWSVNAPTIIEKEEHKSASLDRRLASARKAADRGIPVGFHFHPMVYFTGWQQEYEAVVDAITRQFSPDEVVMISIGTLTFTKEVLRQLRQSQQPSRILQMELVETAGKYSYPVEIKQQLFSHLYASFPQEWRDSSGPFFYLCMELPQLWEPIFGYSYPDNAAFEADMKRHYMQRMGL